MRCGPNIQKQSFSELDLDKSRLFYGEWRAYCVDIGRLLHILGFQ